MKYITEIIEIVNDNELYYVDGDMVYNTEVYDNDEIDGNIEYGTWIPEW